MRNEQEARLENEKWFIFSEYLGVNIRDNNNN